MRWLPRFFITETTVAADDWEAEGPVLNIAWGLFVIEFTFARKVRFFPHERPKANKIISGGAPSKFRFKVRDDD